MNSRVVGLAEIKTVLEKKELVSSRWHTYYDFESDLLELEYGPSKV